MLDIKKIQDQYHDLTRHLIKKKLSITTMESATSGLIASLITDTEGSSAILKGAFVTYSNEAKIKQGVPEETIEKYGVYSRETAEAMACAAAGQYGSDIAIGVTGTLGNVDPANQDSVPGQVYFAIRYQNKTTSWYFELSNQPSRLSYKYAIAQKIVAELTHML